MKKIIFAAIAVCSLGLAQAQKIQFGVKAGINVATISGDMPNVDARLGGHIGGLAEIKFDKFAIQPELLFSLQGASTSFDDYDYEYEFRNNVDLTLNLYYLQIPVMAKYYVIDKLSVELGPQFGLLLAADNTYSGNYFEDDSFSDTDDSKDNFKSIDFGVNFGTTYNFTDHIGASARYTLGLSDIDDAKYEAGESKVKAKNQVFQLSFIYKF